MKKRTQPIDRVLPVNNPPPNMSTQAPCFGQTAASVSAWLKANISVGAAAVVRSSQAGVLSYQFATVTRIGKGRFELDRTGEGAGSTFYYSGKNCFHSKGQTHLVVPTLVVMAACGGPAERGVEYGALTV